MEKCQVLLVYLYRIVDILIIVITLQSINEGIAIKPSSCYTLLGKITIKSTLYSTIFPQLLTTIPHVFHSIVYTFQHTCGKEIHLAPLFIRPFLIHFKAYLSLFVIVFHRNTPKLWKTKGFNLYSVSVT